MNEELPKSLKTIVDAWAKTMIMFWTGNEWEFVKCFISVCGTMYI